MEENFKNINNFYGTNQFYLKEDGGYQSIYNLKNVENIILLNDSISIKFDNNKNLTEIFENEEEAGKFFMYLLFAISEGSRLIGRTIYEHGKENAE